MTAPIINSYKKRILFKRLFGSFTGFELSNYVKNIGLYFLIIFLFLLPWGLSVITLFWKNNNNNKRNNKKNTIPKICDVPIIVVGSIWAVVLLMFFLLGYLINTKKDKREDLIVDEEDSLFGNDERISLAQQFSIIFPYKGIVLIFIHSLISGLLLAYSCVFLSLDNLEQRFENNVVKWILYILGWIVISITQWSLTSKPPVETSIFQTDDELILDNLSRTFYVALLYFLSWLLEKTDVLTDKNIIFHIILVILPILWVFGLLPQFRTLYSWVLEQVVVHILGGTPAASDERSFLYFALGAISIFLSMVFGDYIKTQIGFSIAILLGFLNGVSVFPMPIIYFKMSKHLVTQFFKQPIWIIIFRVILVIIVITVVNILWTVINNVAVRPLFLILTTVLLCVICIVRDIQQQRIFFNIFRNPLYRPQKNNVYQVQNYFMEIIFPFLYKFLYFITPFLTLILGCIYIINRKQEVINKEWGAMEWILTCRFLRILWQCPIPSLMHNCVFYILEIIFHNEKWWKDTNPLLIMIVITYIFQILQQCKDKFLYACHSVASFMTDRKQYVKYQALAIFFIILYTPILLLVILISSMFNSPIVPIFGLPIFVIGYPRPVRQWPKFEIETNYTTSSTSDSLIYRDFTINLKKVINKGMSKGRYSTKVGEMYLCRYDSLILIAQIVESSFTDCIIIFKGLEQQGTSCHNVEARKIDEIFECTNNSPCSIQFPIRNAITPKVPLYCKCYTDIKSKVVGILDNPEVIALIYPTFFKVLIWKLSSMCKEIPNRWLKIDVNKELFNTYWKQFPMSWFDYVTNRYNIFENDTKNDIISVAVMFYSCVNDYTLTMESIYKIFSGKFPLTTSSFCLDEYDDAKNLIIECFRISIKFVFDESIMNNINDYNGMMNTLMMYEKEYCIDMAESPRWLEKLEEKIPNFFTLYKEDGSYYSKTLKRHLNLINFAQINPEIPKGIWANLIFELYYCTNDDDERYSIQANNKILRNIFVQSANTPLGYPVYVNAEKVTVVHCVSTHVDKVYDNTQQETNPYNDSQYDSTQYEV
ncbi:hypothetical protein BCR32DRAFT_289392 [Anaeromyces robustus]|uniref:Pecanex C-terminal domain-containing protein n=1 Tax=Anaeromyces robustus TaxID=1754192 RepID=A0A1Y1XNX0_9FUNG|nr:hypothetical protein BCR32DRAFT_289392 [Anaeromyces robustus]|eukprot:ORX87421.1 hypothetical protein BCR32DRAFT_289392 [Anaeromyces robustus]